MSHNLGSHMTFLELLSSLVLFFFFFLVTSEATKYQLWSREELVKLAGYGEDKLSTVIVMGTLLCQPELRDSQTIAGALVGVKCMVGSKNRIMNWAHGTTDEDGSFLIDVPSHLHAIPDLDKVCLVRVLRLPKNSLCRPTARNKGIRLSSIGNGIRRYTAGNLRLQT